MRPQNTGYNVQQQQQLPQQAQQSGYAQQSFNPNYMSAQQNGVYSQPTNFNFEQGGYNVQSQMQPQQTGYVQSNTPFGNGQQVQMQPQQTGYTQSNAQFTNGQQNPSYQPFSTGTSSPQLFQPMQQQQQPFVSQPSNSAVPAAQSLKRQKTGANIPSTRLSFIQAADQQKFEALFAKAVGPYKTALPGDEAKTILMKSGLPANQLSKIWALSDTSRSGQLLFPEFVLAMHLCNDALRKGRVPDRLDEKVKNEVSGMVDHISFAAADTSAAPSMQPSTSAPNFSTSQPQNQMSNVSIMAQQMQPAQMGFYNAAMTVLPQATAYNQMQPQQTGYNYVQSGLTGVQQPGLTGVGYTQPQQAQRTGFGGQFPMQALISQPTGRPGEWGFVHAPQGSVQGMQALGAAMMPGASLTQGAFQMPTQQRQVEVPWAITKEEKSIYDTIFQAWDKKRQGFVEGPVAIEVFGSSGVERQDLELIWALADADDKGKLNADEFAVALHLIYRKLNGYEVPPVLPPELIPPSTRNFGDSISQVKNMLQQDASSRNGPTSYMKNRSFKDSNANRDYSKDGTVYKHNDADIGYVSSSRRRAPGPAPDSARNSPAPEMPGSSARPETRTLSDLKKQIKEKQVILDALDQQDEGRNGSEELNAQARRDADDLIRQIRKIQAKLDAHQNTHLLAGDENKEKDILHRSLQSLVDKLPEIASQVRKAERRIQEVQYELWSREDQKKHPGSASIVGSGPGGQVTEADRRRAKTKAMMAARTAALTGKQAPKVDDGDVEAAARRQADKVAELTKLRENNEQMIRDIEESAESIRTDIESALSATRAVMASEHERRRWNDGVGVEPEVKDLIHELNKSSSQPPPTQHSPRTTEASTSAKPLRQEAPNRAATPTYSSFNVAEDRAAYLKQAAEARMAERLAALGIRPTKKASREPVAVTNAQNIAEAQPAARQKVIKEERDSQAQERLAIEERTKKEEAALLEAQKQQDEQLKRLANEKETGSLDAREAQKQQVVALKPVDSRQVKLAALRAEREARLAEEERLERELAEDSATSESEAEPPIEIKQSNPFNRAKQGEASGVFETTPQPAQPAMSPIPTRNMSETPQSTESNNPYHKANAQTSSPVIHRPPSAAPLVAQRTNAPRVVPVRKNSDDWSVVSKEDDSSSDEEGPSPADLAARLFSGGIVPQRTGGAQTPIVAQRTGAAEPVRQASPSQVARPTTSSSSIPAVPVGIPPPPPPRKQSIAPVEYSITKTASSA